MFEAMGQMEENFMTVCHFAIFPLVGFWSLSWFSFCLISQSISQNQPLNFSRSIASSSTHVLLTFGIPIWWFCKESCSTIFCQKKTYFFTNSFPYKRWWANSPSSQEGEKEQKKNTYMQNWRVCKVCSWSSCMCVHCMAWLAGSILWLALQFVRVLASWPLPVLLQQKLAYFGCRVMASVFGSRY